MQDRLDQAPKSMRIRRAKVEHPFDTLMAWMGDPLQDQGAQERQHGDEPPRPGLQSEAGDRHPRGGAAHPGHAGLRRRPQSAA